MSEKKLIKVSLELDLNEYKTLVSALNARGNNAFRAATNFAQKHTRSPTGEAYTIEDFRCAMDVSNRAFKLQKLIQEQYKDGRKEMVRARDILVFILWKIYLDTGNSGYSA